MNDSPSLSPGEGTVAADQGGSSPIRFQPRLVPSQPDGRHPDQVIRTAPPAMPLALYAHVPFCVTRCYFCDFVTVVGKHVTPETVARYQHALLTELRGLAGHETFGRKDLATAQIGGGTPTMLDPHQLEQLLAAVCEFMTDTPGAEIVVEGFPTSVAPEKLAVLAAVPRLKFNMGVQTFNDMVLAAIGRKHEREDALRAIGAARASDIRSVGIDLMYGLPTADANTVRSDLKIALSYDLNHIALYPLWIYPKTRLNSMVEVGRHRDATLTERFEQLQEADAMLIEHGFHRYTAFHYATADDHHHRYGLWQMRGSDWIGAGQGAVSQLAGVIYENDRTYSGYTARALAGTECAVSAEPLAVRASMARRLSYGIRLRSYPEVDFAETFGCDVEDAFEPQLRWMEDEGLIERAGGAISLTLWGILRLGEIEEAISPAPEPLGQLTGVSA